MGLGISKVINTLIGVIYIYIYINLIIPPIFRSLVTKSRP